MCDQLAEGYGRSRAADSRATVDNRLRIRLRTVLCQLVNHELVEHDSERVHCVAGWHAMIRPAAVMELRNRHGFPAGKGIRQRKCPPL